VTLTFLKSARVFKLIETEALVMRNVFKLF
jgi:hypothetical protein